MNDFVFRFIFVFTVLLIVWVFYVTWKWWKSASYLRQAVRDEEERLRLRKGERKGGGEGGDDSPARDLDPVEQATEAINANPTDPEAWLMRADARTETRDFAGAAADYTRALELGACGSSPGDSNSDAAPPEDSKNRRALSDLYLHRGRAHLLSGENSAAQADLKRALDLDNDNWYAIRYQSSAQADGNDLDAARETLKKALEQEAQVIENLFSQAAGLAGEDKRKALGHAYLRRAEARFEAGNFEGAADDLKETQLLRHEMYESWFMLTGALRAMGNLDGALEMTTMSIKYRPSEQPETWPAYLNEPQHPGTVWLATNLIIRSSILRAKGDRAAALADLDTLISLNPVASDSRHIRADARAWLGETDGALADYAEAARLDSTDADAHLKTALLLRKRGDTNDALAAFDKAIKASPRDEVALLFRSRTRAAIGQTEGAREDLAAALKVNPRLAERFLDGF